MATYLELKALFNDSDLMDRVQVAADVWYSRMRP
jgi:hypothetical protein